MLSRVDHTIRNPGRRYASMIAANPSMHEYMVYCYLTEHVKVVRYPVVAVSL